MKFKTLPGTDLRVSTLCLGTMNFGQQNTEEDAHAQLDFAVSKGINFIDTAEMYPVPPEKEKQGLTETYVGSWLRKRGKRGDLVVASKVSSRNQSAPMRTRDARGGLTKKNILAAIDGTLERLQTDYVDLYQVHTPDRHTNFFGKRGVESLDGDDGVPIEETLEGMHEVVKSGKARAIGVSNETPWGLNEYLRFARQKGYTKISTIQNYYSILGRTFEVGLSEICLRENVGLLPFSVLNRGVISGKYLGGARPPGARFTLWERDIDRYNPSHAEPAVKAYMALAKKLGIEPAQLAIAFASSRTFTTSVIIAATSLKQLEIDIPADDIVLTQDALAEIKRIYTTMPDPTC